jgi:hypothetical protein
MAQESSPSTARSSGCKWRTLRSATASFVRFTEPFSLPLLVLVAANAFSVFANQAHAQTACVDVTASGLTGDNLVGDGVTDNTAKFNALVAQLINPVAGKSPQPGPSGWCISFPAGKYLFKSAPAAINYPTAIYSVTIAGAGADNTTLFFSGPNGQGSNGITVNAQDTGTQALQSIHVRDLTFTTAVAGGYSALILAKTGSQGTFAQSDIVRTTFRGDDGGALAYYWAAAVNVSGLSDINFDGDLFYGADGGGTGIVLAGSGIGGVGTVYNIANSGFYSLGIGLAIESYVTGVTVTQSNFVNGSTCIWVPPSVSGVSNIAIVGGNNFNCTGTQILLQSPVNSLVMNGNLIYLGYNGTNNIGVWLDAPGGQQYSFVNNVFSGLWCCGLSATGIVANFSGSGTVNSAVVMGNTFFNLTLGTDLTDAKYWNVQGNFYTPAITPNPGTTPVLNPNMGNMNSVGAATP